MPAKPASSQREQRRRRFFAAIATPAPSPAVHSRSAPRSDAHETSSNDSQPPQGDVSTTPSSSRPHLELELSEQGSNKYAQLKREHAAGLKTSEQVAQALLSMISDEGATVPSGSLMDQVGLVKAFKAVLALEPSTLPDKLSQDQMSVKLR